MSVDPRYDRGCRIFFFLAEVAPFRSSRHVLTQGLIWRIKNRTATSMIPDEECHGLRYTR